MMTYIDDQDHSSAGLKEAELFVLVFHHRHDERESERNKTTFRVVDKVSRVEF